MALSIKDPEADRLARELARRQKKTLTRAVVDALGAELAREKRRVRQMGLLEELRAIRRRVAALPTLDHRSDDEILGYDEQGIPER